RMLSCGYHGRCFRLDGTIKSMPGFEGVENFPSESDHLKNLSLERIGPLLFSSLQPRYSFREIFGAMMDRLHWLPVDTLEFDPTTSVDYYLDAHWALYCDNYLEGFHIPFVHPGLNDAVTDDYTYELFPYCNLQLSIAEEGEPHYEIPESSVDYGKKVYAFYYWVFPNLMFNWYPWGLSLNVVEPRGLDKTRIRFLSFKYKDTKFDILDNRLHQTEMEDEAVVLDVQAGIQSQIYERGRYSPSMEQGVHHFHRLLTSWLLL
ncbi:MAG: SRPBCC family protein, partial [Bacteroidota bacterium]